MLASNTDQKQITNPIKILIDLFYRFLMFFGTKTDPKWGGGRLDLCGSFRHPPDNPLVDASLYLDQLQSVVKAALRHLLGSVCHPPDNPLVDASLYLDQLQSALKVAVRHPGE